MILIFARVAIDRTWNLIIFFCVLISFFWIFLFVNVGVVGVVVFRVGVDFTVKNGGGCRWWWRWRRSPVPGATSSDEGNSTPAGHLRAVATSHLYIYIFIIVAQHLSDFDPFAQINNTEKIRKFENIRFHCRKLLPIRSSNWNNASLII